MTSRELRFNNRTVYFRKATSAPIIGSDSVLTRDPFEFVALWLARNCTAALPFWRQAEAYHQASMILPPVSAPLTLYYCYLNCVKALLIVKQCRFTDRHGVSGTWNPMSKRILSNEIIELKNSGIVTALGDYFGESATSRSFTLQDALGNLPFIHRAFRHTFRSKPELFVPLVNPVYHKHPSDRYVWLSAEIRGKFSDHRSLRTLPDTFEVVNRSPGKAIIRSKKRIKWHNHNATAKEKEAALKRLWVLHRKMRQDISFISAPVDLWYLKRDVSGAVVIPRSNLVIVMAAMHRLSELARYDPAGLERYLSADVNWLLSEFIRLSPSQFVDELACEITGLEMRMPGVRPS